MRPLYGAIEPSLIWQGGFYVRSPGSGEWALRLEFEGHEHTNRVRVNGQTVGYLPSQTWADMWMSAALPVPAALLKPGYNELTIEVGRAIPGCQVPGNAWDELLFRRVRLERARPAPLPAASSTPVVLSRGRPVTIVDFTSAPRATVQQVASGLEDLGVARVAPCHCTGAPAVALLAAAFGDRYQRCGVGLVLREGE